MSSPPLSDRVMIHVNHLLYRLNILPHQLQLLAQAKLEFSTSSTLSVSPQAYPFPTNPRPTPHQIFHLRPGCTQKDIKARYYDLVRCHHPDSVHCRSLSPSERHARFQAINKAYDILRGKSSGFPAHDPYMEEVMRRKQFYEAHYRRRAQYARPPRTDWPNSGDDRWKDQVILLVGILTLAGGLAPGLFVLPFYTDKQHRLAVENLSQARKEARKSRDMKRSELQKRDHELQSGSDVPPGRKTPS